MHVAVIQIVRLDPLRDDGFAYVDKLRSDGVGVQLEVFPGLPHGFCMISHLDATRKYIGNVVDFVRKFSE